MRRSMQQSQVAMQAFMQMRSCVVPQVCSKPNGPQLLWKKANCKKNSNHTCLSGQDVVQEGWQVNGEGTSIPDTHHWSPFGRPWNLKFWIKNSEIARCFLGAWRYVKPAAAAAWTSIYLPSTGEIYNLESIFFRVHELASLFQADKTSPKEKECQNPADCCRLGSDCWILQTSWSGSKVGNCVHNAIMPFCDCIDRMHCYALFVKFLMTPEGKISGLWPALRKWFWSWLVHFSFSVFLHSSPPLSFLAWCVLPAYVFLPCKVVLEKGWLSKINDLKSLVARNSNLTTDCCFLTWGRAFLHFKM